MKDFVVKTIVANDIEAELEKIGFDIAYRTKAADKYRYNTLKIFALTLHQANILNQTALSLGADCAVHRDVLVNKVEATDVILGGSISQLHKICDKLKLHPFSLKILAEQIEAQLKQSKRTTKLVGILNLTPDSFSNDGVMNEKQAVERLYQLIDDGADMVDIGAESTRPNSQPIPPEEQIKRLNLVANEFKNVNIPISIDTRSSDVARFALKNGAKIINDVSGMEYDKKLLDVVSEFNAGIVIQHSTGNAENIIKYDDIIEDVYISLLRKSELAKSKGVENIIIDVGIGFGKSKDDCKKLLDRVEEFYSLNLPLMVGLSRKSFLGVNNDDNVLKDSLTLALSYPLMQKGVDYLRVHNVKAHRQLLNLVY